jgi:cyclic beta-1,2-glucan synthetase
VRPPSVLSLHARLNDNAAVLLAAYRAGAAELESGRGVVPAAEWLLDNYQLVEQQIREIRDDLPVGYYRQLPKLAEGPFAGYPRVFGLAWAFVAPCCTARSQLNGCARLKLPRQPSRGRRGAERACFRRVGS